MSNKKQTKTRIPETEHVRLKQQLGDTTITDFLEGAIYDFLEGDLSAEHYERIAEMRELRGETAEIEGQIDQIDDQIAELEKRREKLQQEREEKRERLDEIEEQIEQAAAGDGSSGRTPVEEVAYDVLVQVAHDQVGSNGLTAGAPAVGDAAKRAGVGRDEIIESMREQAAPAGDALQREDLVERGMLRDDEIRTRKQERPSPETFDRLRTEIAERVLDDDDVDWERVPDSEAMFGG